MTSDDSKHAYLSADQLRVGVFVLLDLPWFKHDFAVNSFKVRTEDQLRELRQLKLERYRYDPARSDPLPELSPLGEVLTDSTQSAEGAERPVRSPAWAGCGQLCRECWQGSVGSHDRATPRQYCASGEGLCESRYGHEEHEP
jgi:hypothetical protein